MQPISALTYKVVAYKAAPQFDINECVEWALEMILLNYESESLLILAGLTKPVDYFEAVKYLEASIKELDLQTLTDDEGIVSYCSYYITQIAKGLRVKENLALSCDYMLSIEYHSSIYDFCRLHWAWQELEYDGKQWYWDERRWITLNKLLSIQPINGL